MASVRGRGEKTDLGLKYSLAAMDGMSHAAFRSICFEYGAEDATTEMVSAISYARARRKRQPILDAQLMRRPEETRLAAQIIGCEPEIMAAAAQKLEKTGHFDAIEINMGCPARTVVGGGSGSAILQNPQLAGEILRAVCGATSLPVRLKLRLGWDDKHITAPEIACMAQNAGCSALILHGRTRSQMYRGSVLLEEMKRVRAAVTIPLYANGAVVSAADAAPFGEAVGAQGVCIGRAALKAPWIFDDIRRLERGEAPVQRDAAERVDVLLRLGARMCDQKPERLAMCEIRKFCTWYLTGLTGAEEVCKQLHRVEQLDGLRRTLEGYLDGLVAENDVQLHPELLPEVTLDTVDDAARRCGCSVLL